MANEKKTEEPLQREPAPLGMPEDYVDWVKGGRLSVAIGKTQREREVGWLSDIQIGLRSDGVLVWRRVA